MPDPDSAAARCLAHLRPGLSASSAALLETLLGHASVRFDEAERAWVCDFPPAEVEGEAEGEPIDRHLVIDAAAASKIPAGTPAPLAALLGVCRGMTCGEQGNTGQLVLHDGADGTLHVVGDDALSERACGFAYSSDLCSPIDMDLQSFFLFHPETGRLCLYDDGVLEFCETDDPVEAYLRELVARFRV